jgi:hypothetical protein
MTGVCSPDLWSDLMRLTCLLAVMSLACSGQDPILERAAEMEGGDTPPTAGAPAPGKTGSAPVKAGTPAQPAPGRGAPPAAGTPGEPTPGDPGQPAPGTPEQPAPGVPGADGPSVVLSGTVAVASWGGGPIRIDIFDGDQQAAAGSGKRPSVVAQARLDAPGAFEVRVPTSAGRVWIGAFADENRNGRPDPRDPSAWFGGNPVSTDEARGGIALSLEAAPPPGGGVEME